MSRNLERKSIFSAVEPVTDEVRQEPWLYSILALMGLIAAGSIWFLIASTFQ